MPHGWPRIAELGGLGALVNAPGREKHHCWGQVSQIIKWQGPLGAHGHGPVCQRPGCVAVWPSRRIDTTTVVI